MATWVRFKDQLSGAEFYHFNTHFEFLVPYSRLKSAELLSQRIAVRRYRLPVVVTGDFNSLQTSRPHRILASPGAGLYGLVDSWDQAKINEGLRVSTYHGWRGPKTKNRRIDWVLTSPDIECRRARVVLYAENGEWPSDHFPVVTALRWPTR
jgi:endonuclease/exonuclease/phosphatase family metal-dependent hydrolase